ncbi:MAG TPA: hypothetical protein VHQ47_06965 [Phycisphaerae bacterium]|jgi:hypothetical protein|nr:hypothetical protein [Phycisphaerae bacterium]
MSTVTDSELLCPTCSYDLRAALLLPGPLRCPECGARWPRDIVSSRIPWIHRHRRRRLSTYLGTLWMFLRRGDLLAREANARVRKSDAQLFAAASFWIALLLGLLITGGIFSFLLSTGGLNTIPAFNNNSPWIAYPLAASLDWRVFFLAAFLWLWCSLHSIAWLYRWIIGWQIAPRAKRRRVRRLASYALALLPLDVALLGSAAACWFIGSSALSPAPIAQWLPLLATLLVLAACLLLIAPTLVFTWSTGGNRGCRCAAMTLLYPLLCAVLIWFLLFAIFWAAGFIAMAVWSLLHQ